MATMSNSQFIYGKRKDLNYQYDCEFCSDKFSSRFLRNEHILTHFDTENCLHCNKNLIRVGEKWYELHSAINCIQIKCDPDNIVRREEECVLKVVECDPLLEFDENKESGSNLNETQANIDINDEEMLNDCFADSVCSSESENAMEYKVSEEIKSQIEQTNANTVNDTSDNSGSNFNNELNHKNERKFKCDLCDASFKRNSDLTRHKKLHTARGSQYKCEICKKQFISFRTLNEHQPIHADKFSAHEIDTKQRKSLLRDHNKTEKFVCRLCGNNYGTAKSFDWHIVKYHKVKCSYCSKRFYSQTEVNYHEHTHIFPTFTCDVCQVKFVSLSDVRKHMLLKHLNLYQCTFPECGKKFSYKLDYDRHINFHNGVKNYQCDTCGKCFVQKSALHVHVARHSRTLQKAKLQCTFEGCDNSFASEKALHEHTKEHDPNAKRFQCESCSKIFFCEQKLKNHRISVHPKDRNFKCEYCNKAFKTKAGLNNHRNFHTMKKEYKCKICQKVFLSHGNLISHQLVHTGEKPHKCTIEGCDRAYMYSIDLKRHKYGAHGIYTKQHPCTVCGKIFPENKILKKHLETHK